MVYDIDSINTDIYKAITAAIFKDAEKNGHLWVQRNKLPPLPKRRIVWDTEREG